MKKEFLEQLKKLAISTPLTPALDDETNFDKVNKFITIFNIKEGKNRIRPGLIYKVYSDWSEKPIGKKSFGNEFVKFFAYKHDNKNTYYELNYKPGSLVKKGKELTDARNSVE